jgi:hypothetical protein
MSPGTSLAVDSPCIVLAPWGSLSLWSSSSRARSPCPCHRTRVLRCCCGVLDCSSSASGTGTGVRRCRKVVVLVVASVLPPHTPSSCFSLLGAGAHCRHCREFLAPAFHPGAAARKAGAAVSSQDPGARCCCRRLVIRCRGWVRVCAYRGPSLQPVYNLGK